MINTSGPAETVCIAEDRASEQVAIKLLIVSLARHCPQLHVELFYPPADEEMRAWLNRFPNVHLREQRIAGVSDWNVKPYAIRQLLAEGFEEVWWLDSDIIVQRDFRKELGELTARDLIATEEAAYGKYRDEGYRARAWGFEVERELPFTLNSCVMRMTQKHRRLLAAWCDALETPLYQEAQSRPEWEKPFHLYGDQDVLTALLSSDPFASIPLKVLRRGRGIIQYFGPSGYTMRERLATLLTPPAILHCQRDKPWRRAAAAPSVRLMTDYLKHLRLETSPYTLAAKRYAREVEEPLPWTTPNSIGGMVLRTLGLGHLALAGMPLALFYTAVRSLKALFRVRDRFDPAQAFEAMSAAWRPQQPSRDTQRRAA